CGLAWADVDLDAGLLTVRRSRKHEPGGIVLGEVKTAGSRRCLDLPTLATEGLRAHRARQAAERLTAGPAWQDLDLVFTTRIGTPIDRWSLRRSFTTLTEAAGLGAWHPHEARHSAASILSDAGVPLEQIADVLGHAPGSRMTAGVYRHQINPTIAAARRAMDNLFAPTAATGQQ
ncbi:MAG: site-specific integrase, partial [Acidimicrobiales bacterium]